MKKKVVNVIAATMALNLALQIPVFAAEWKWDDQGWYLENSDSKNAWEWVDANRDGIAECYYFGPNGYLLSDAKTPDGYTVNANGAWTVNGAVQGMNTKTKKVMSMFPEANKTTEIGPGFNNGTWRQENGKWWYDIGSGMFYSNGWFWIDGNKDGTSECYYFDQNGWMLSNTTTPDGYTVNGNGAWTVNGQVQTRTRSNDAKKEVAKVSNIKSHSSSSGDGSSGSGSGSGGSTDTKPDKPVKPDTEGKPGSGSDSSTTIAYQDDFWEGYRGYSNAKLVNDYETGNISMLNDSQKETVEWFCSEIVYETELVESDKSDFEKEMIIIDYLFNAYEFTDEPELEIFTAYDLFDNGMGSSTAFADAFVQIAKAAGLEARYIHNDKHAWNLVKLDDDWYHVDVTLEKPSHYQVETLRNRYINRTDKEMEKSSIHKTWNKEAVKAIGTKYGPEKVHDYFAAGELGGLNIEEAIDNLQAGHMTILPYTTKDDVIKKLKESFDKVIEERNSLYSFGIEYSDVNGINMDDYKKVVSLNKDIQKAMADYAKEKYGKMLQSPLEFTMHTVTTENKELYSYSEMDIRYNQGYGIQTSYMINFVDEDNTSVGTQKGVGEENTAIKVNVPNGYVLTDELVINTGYGYLDGDKLVVIAGPLEAEIRVQKIKIPSDSNATPNDDAVLSPSNARK